MGVAGLWDILRPAGKPRSLTHLTVVDGFEQNLSGKRAYRVGIDASIWFFHAEGGQGGENPQLRTLYFRCCRLLALPVLPLFVFDGPKRPNVKRGKRIGKSENWLVNNMRKIVTAFGFEHWTAPGEAEAELAYLNQIGVIDGILSDDVDTFLFGAKVVIRNPSATLSGSQAHARQTGQTEKSNNHVVIYRSDAIEEHPSVTLTQAGVILIGLLCGGDYDSSGLVGCGLKTAHGLARCGFGEELLRAFSLPQAHERSTRLAEWRDALRDELRTNQSGLLGKKFAALSRKIPEDFPDLEVLQSYAMPITSLTEGYDTSVIQWSVKPSMAKIANVCELFFEWGIRETIINRFRTHMWSGALLRTLLEASLARDARQSSSGPHSTPRKAGHSARQASLLTPATKLAKYLASLNVESPAGADMASLSDRIIVKIHSSRTHASTDGLLEYRLEFDPSSYVEEVEAGLQDLRVREDNGYVSDGESKPKKSPVHPTMNHREWMPAVMVKMAEPRLVEEYEAALNAKAAKAACKSTRKAKAGASKPPARKAKRADSSSDDDDDNLIVASPSKPVRKTKPSSRAAAPLTLFFPPKPTSTAARPVTSSNVPISSGPAGSQNDPFAYLSGPAASSSHSNDDPFAYLSGPKPKAGKNTKRSAPATVSREYLDNQTDDAGPDPFAYLRERTNYQAGKHHLQSSAASSDDRTNLIRFHRNTDTNDIFGYSCESRLANEGKRQLPLTLSESDEDNQHRQSPRKSKSHISPRKVPLPAESSSDEGPSRPVSPSPMRRPIHRKTLSTTVTSKQPVEVIEISSGPDSPQAPAPKAISRLTVLKGKGKVQGSARSSATQSVSQAQLVSWSEVDIIDLT